MHGSLHKPIADQATQTFVTRCAEIGLDAWGLEDGALLPLSAHPDTGLAESLSGRIDELMGKQSPIEIAPGRFAVGITDAEGLSQGFVVSPAEGSALRLATPDQLNATAKALAWSLADLRRADQSLFAVEDLTDQLGKCYENITLMYGIGQSIRTTQTPDRMANGICEQMRMTQSYGWSAVRYIKDDQDSSGLSDVCMITGDMPCSEDAFRKATDQMLETGRANRPTKLLQVGVHALADLVGSEVILEPIMHDDREIGLVLAGGKTGPDAEATSGDTQLLGAIAGFLGALHENAARFIEQKNMFIGSLQAVSNALDAKDRYTHGHSERVAWLGTQLAKAIGLDDAEVERIRISGLVHDVGKIGVPEAVLCKTGRLTEDEFDQIKKHPRIGYNILKGIPKMEDVLDGVLYHHERWDGCGYPDKLAGEGIPLYGRILAVADTFDAMSSTRSYRTALPREQVLQEILNCAGTQFDPSLTGPFVALDLTEYDRMVAEHQDSSESQQKERAA